jgi:hypothetical protein
LLVTIKGPFTWKMIFVCCTTELDRTAKTRSFSNWVARPKFCLVARFRSNDRALTVVRHKTFFLFYEEPFESIYVDV